MMGIGFVLVIVGIGLFWLVRPDEYPEAVSAKVTAPLIASSIVGGAALIAASICVWLYRVMP